jgi:putative membrane protein
MIPPDRPGAHVLAFVVRLVLSAGALMLAVGWVSPNNKSNTFGRAVVVSLILAFAWYITLAKFLWFLVVPWLIYVIIWLIVIAASYGLGLLSSLLLALALSFLSWLVAVIFGVTTF